MQLQRSDYVVCSNLTIYSTVVTLHKNTPLNISMPSLFMNHRFREITCSQSISDGCCVLKGCRAHLSLAIGFHEFDERRVSFDLELHYRSILTCYLQVYVFVVFRLDCFLRDEVGERKTVDDGTEGSRAETISSINQSKEEKRKTHLQASFRKARQFY